MRFFFFLTLPSGLSLSHNNISNTDSGKVRRSRAEIPTTTSSTPAAKTSSGIACALPADFFFFFVVVELNSAVFQNSASDATPSPALLKSLFADGNETRSAGKRRAVCRVISVGASAIPIAIARIFLCLKYDTHDIYKVELNIKHRCFYKIRRRALRCCSVRLRGKMISNLMWRSPFCSGFFWFGMPSPRTIFS